MLPWYKIRGLDAYCGTLKVETHIRRILWDALAQSANPPLKSQVKVSIGMSLLDPYPGYGGEK
jgi:hypothetical protein